MGIATESYKKNLKGIEKVPTGIKGFDEISFGGIPKGRPTLICGNTGCGKTLMALEIIIRSAIEHNIPGIFIAFEETRKDLIQNVASLGFDLEELERKNLIYIDFISLDKTLESGEYDLQGLFIRIEYGIQKINAKMIAIDTMEALFSSFQNQNLLRSELKRLFMWLKEKNLTAIVTGEQGGSEQLTRQGIEEYVVDCVIYLTHSVAEELYTRRLQIIKYRGSHHETNQFPFLITRKGISLLPITSLELKMKSLTDRISTGIPQLDELMEGKGFFEGSSILISGTSGSGKTTFLGSFAKEVCNNNKKCLFFTYEESESEILRNLNSVGVNLKHHIEAGNLKIVATRPTQWGLEKHLAYFIEIIDEFEPDAVAIDPISTLTHSGTSAQVYSILSRMIDYLKRKNITLLMTILYYYGRGEEFSLGISSVIDTWILLKNDEREKALKRELLIVKSRGMKHSNKIWGVEITSEGIKIKNE